MLAATARLVCLGAVCVALPLPANGYRPYVLRHAALAFLNALLLVMTLGTTLILTLTPDVARLSTITVSSLVRLANAERVKAGVPPLRENPLLQRSAQHKAEDMVRHDYFEHTSPAGVSPWHWFDTSNYSYLYAGENLAIDFLEAEEVVAAWMRSPGHRRNLLSNHYADIGMAVLTGEFEGRTTTVVVQHFGSLVATAGLPTTAERRVLAEGEALTPPVLTEPRNGTRLGRGPFTVRGEVSPGSTVRLLLDGKFLTAVPATGTRFSTTVLAPRETEGEVTLTAIAVRDHSVSSPTRPVVLHIDTRAPEVAPDRAALLPDPRGLPGRAVVAIPATPDVAQATLRLSGGRPVSLTKIGALLAARVPIADLLTDTRGTAPPVLAVSDDRGNSREVALQTILPYVSQRPVKETERPRVAAAARRARPIMSVSLVGLAISLLVSFAVHLRRHRLLHADVLIHAVTVLVVGVALLAWT